MKIALATDHAGFELKEYVKVNLLEIGLEIHDFGAYNYDALDDYPDFIQQAAKFISEKPKMKAIIFGGSGQGEAIVANRYKNVRAAVYYGGSIELIKLSRLHNNSNVLSIGARFVDHSKIIEVIQLWIKTSFEGGRHKKRIDKIDSLKK